MPHHINIHHGFTCIIKVKNLTLIMIFENQYFYFSSLILKNFSKKFKLFLLSFPISRNKGKRVLEMYKFVLSRSYDQFYLKYYFY